MAQPQDGGQPDPRRAAAQRAKLPADRRAEGVVLEEFGQDGRCEIALAAGRRQIEPGGMGSEAASAEIRRRQRRIEIAQFAKAGDQHCASITRRIERARAHRPRQEGGGQGRADGGREQGVARQIADERIAGGAAAFAQAFQRRREGVGRDARVGMVGIGGEPRHRGQRRVAARHADRAVRPVGRAMPLRQDQDATPRLGQPQPAEQSRQPRADHDYVVSHRPSDILARSMPQVSPITGAFSIGRVITLRHQGRQIAAPVSTVCALNF